MAFERDILNQISNYPADGLTGRRKVTTVYSEITPQNVVKVLEDTLKFHDRNKVEIDYLFNYYRGVQDVRNKRNLVRENINNRITVNNANKIVSFKSAFFLGAPITYVSSATDDTNDNLTKKIEQLNGFMRAEDKKSKDKELIDWMHICGIAERLVLTDKMANEVYGAPFYIYTLDPREAYPIYYAGIEGNQLGGVLIRRDVKDKEFYEVYTAKEMITYHPDNGVTVKRHRLGAVPLIEYNNNMARMGAFEPVVPILNAINDLESYALDGVQEFVNGFDVFSDCEVQDGEYSSLSLGGKALQIRSTGSGVEPKVYRVTSELSQSGVQQRLDDLNSAVLEICGMPNRNGGSSTSDTGQAVIYRDGFFEAESRAKDTEAMFEPSERQFLRIVLNICNGKKWSSLSGLKLGDISVNFGRKSLDNMPSKWQCLIEGLNNPSIHPQDVFSAFGDMLGDPNRAYSRGMQWREKVEKAELTALNEELIREQQRVANASVQTGGQSD